ncbi:MAG: GntR family transcriptional regulator [Acidaminococcus sp.]|nr:GntR family transcriptional regulator [Acidaminococcus sp.]
MENLIKTGAWPVGEKIPSEMELMETLGVSRNTVREATLSLVHSGLLRAIPGDGTYVIAADRLDAALQSRFRDAKFRDVIEVRYALEVTTVQLAAEFSEEEDIQKLAEIKERWNSANPTSPEFVECDMEFHTQIAKMSHNKLMFDLYNSCDSFIRDAIKAYQVKASNYWQKDEHTELYEGIRHHDVPRAVKAIRMILDEERALFKKFDLFD